MTKREAEIGNSFAYDCIPVTGTMFDCLFCREKIQGKVGEEVSLAFLVL